MVMTKETNMSEEILDLVDENDNIIGEVKISEANRDPRLIHREVAIFIFDGRKRILWQQRSYQKIHEPGLWTIAASGHVTKGMSPEETAHKELKEELGFDTDLKFVEKFRYDSSTESRFMSLYLGKYSGEKIIPDSKEVAQAKFFSREDFAALVRSDAAIGKKSEEIARRFWAGEFDNLL